MSINVIQLISGHVIGEPNVIVIQKFQRKKQVDTHEKKCALGVTMLTIGTKTLAKEKGCLSFVSTKTN